MLGKEMNKLKNKGLLAAALSDDDKQTADRSDESIAEGELVRPVDSNGRTRHE